LCGLRELFLQRPWPIGDDLDARFQQHETRVDSAPISPMVMTMAGSCNP